jgi:hypothetical protein
MPAALDGAAGRLQGIECRVWAANLYLHANAVLCLNPLAQAAYNDFNKKMYRHGPGVLTGLCGLYHVMPYTSHYGHAHIHLQDL